MHIQHSTHLLFFIVQEVDTGPREITAADYASIYMSPRQPPVRQYSVSHLQNSVSHVIAAGDKATL